MRGIAGTGFALLIALGWAGVAHAYGGAVGRGPTGSGGSAPEATTPSAGTAAPAVVPTPTDAAGAPESTGIPGGTAVAEPVAPSVVEQLPSEAVGKDEALLPEPEIKQKKGKHKKGRGGDRGAGEGGLDVPGTSFGALQLGGRVIGQVEFLSHKQNLINGMGFAVPTTVRSLDLSVPHARLEASYQTPIEWLSAKIEVDVAGKPDMKDGYVQAKTRYVSARLGQFKMPVAAIETESPWTLPLARRGLVHDLLVDWLDYGGRRPGAMVTARGRGGLKPRLSAGAFQGSVLESLAPDDRQTDTLRRRSLTSQSLIARGQIEIADTEIGAYYEHRIGSPVIGQPRRYWTAGVDAKIDHPLDGGGVRVWADAIAGSSWYRQGADTSDTTFMGGRVLAAYRWGGVAVDDPYFEPFVFGGLFDPDNTITSDLAWEGTVGFNFGYWHRARLTLQGEVNRADRNFPALYFGGQDPDRIGVIMEAGIAF